MIRIATFFVTTTIAAVGCSIPYTCDGPVLDVPDGGELHPNPGANGLPAACEPFGGRCDPNRCNPREHMTPAPRCECEPDYEPDAGAPI
jgi:hypothetical protein